MHMFVFIMYSVCHLVWVQCPPHPGGSEVIFFLAFRDSVPSGHFSRMFADIVTSKDSHFNHSATHTYTTSIGEFHSLPNLKRRKP